jgi:hypothetical protein
MSRFTDLDKRWIYVFLVVVVAIPLLRPFGLPFGVTKPTRDAFATVEKLQPGDVAVFDFGYNPGGAAEVNAQAQILFTHCMMRGARIISFSMDQQGSRYADLAWEPWEKEGKVYGTDFVNLGFFAGGEMALASFAKDIPEFTTQDAHGDKVSGMPVFKGITTAGDVDLFVSISTSTILPFIQYFHGPYGKPVTGGALGVQISRYQSYADAGQLQGYLGSLRGAAEYEKLLNVPGKATSSMDAQSAAHLLIAVLIVLGNLIDFSSKRPGKTAGKEA